MTKLCVNCRWYRKDWISHLLFMGDRYDRCFRPSNENLVTGESYAKFCEIERKYEPPTACGKEGKYWEEIQ